MTPTPSAWPNRLATSRFRWAANLLLAVQLLCAGSAVLAEEILLQTKSYQATLGKNAVWQSLVDTQSNRSLLATDRKTSIAFIQIDGKTYSANSADRQAERLTVGFSGVDTQLNRLLITRDLDYSRITKTGPKPNGNN